MRRATEYEFAFAGGEEHVLPEQAASNRSGANELSHAKTFRRRFELRVGDAPQALRIFNSLHFVHGKF